MKEAQPQNRRQSAGSQTPNNIACISKSVQRAMKTPIANAIRTRATQPNRNIPTYLNQANSSKETIVEAKEQLLTQATPSLNNDIKDLSKKQSGWSTKSKNNGEGTSGDLITYSNVIENRVLSPSFSLAEKKRNTL